MGQLPMTKARRSTALAVVVVTAIFTAIGSGSYTVYANHSTISSLKSELSKKDRIIDEKDNFIQNQDAIIDHHEDTLTKQQKEVEEKQHQIQEKDQQVNDLKKQVALRLDAQAEAKAKARLLQLQKKQEAPVVQAKATQVRTLTVQTAKQERHQDFQGGWIATFYSLNVESTGKRPGQPGYGITRSGRGVESNVTIAVDPKIIPLGSWVEIEFPDGHIEKRRADDTGGAIRGKHIDVYTSGKTQKQLLKFGKQDIKIRVLKNNPSV